MSRGGFVKPREVSRRMAVDTAMALTLLPLLVGLGLRERWPFQVAVVVLVLGMVAPMLFRYPAVVWFGLGHALGAVSSRIILFCVFFLVVFPIGVARRLAGKDALSLRRFRNGTGSLFAACNKRFSADDLIHPY